YTLVIVDGRKQITTTFGKSSCRSDNEVALKAMDSYQALQSLIHKRADLWMIDVNLPYMKGTCLAKVIFTSCKSSNATLTSYPVSKKVLDILEEISTNGLLDRQRLQEEMLTRLAYIHKENLCYHPEQSLGIRQSLTFLQRENTYLAKLHRLTSAEKHVLHLISNGFTTPQISHKLCNSTYTIKNHRHNMCEKLELCGKANALFDFLMEGRVWLQQELRTII
ncbi:MAG: LuxR C-terminal-related transcriptional regulator, partial [Bacteroidota bacterium]